MGSKNDNQLSEKIISQAFEFDATSVGIAQPTELVIFLALLDVDRGVIKL